MGRERGGRLTVKIIVSLTEVEEITSLKVLHLWKSSSYGGISVLKTPNRLNIQHCVAKFKKLQP
jgi:hypothetical protein